MDNTPQIRPKFRPDIVVRRFEEKDGAYSIVLEDPVANKFFRISQYEYDLFRVLDGTRTLQEALERAKLHGRHFTPEHAAGLVDQFSRSGLLLNTPYSTSASQIEIKKRLDAARRSAKISQIFFVRFPLINPDKFLERTLWLWRLAANRLLLSFVALLTPGALYLLVSQTDRLHNEFLYFFNWQNLLILWAAIALVKLAHEFSHAYTAKSYGLRVPEMGIALLIFFPALYCNTTTAWQLADRKQRMSISLAGVLSEACIAVIAVYMWTWSRPGLFNSVMFFIMTVSVVSSLLFNGNPLMKFDGYFVFSDWLRMPNLQTHSIVYLKEVFLEGVLGVDSPRKRTVTDREKFTYFTYGVAAFIYRFFLYSGIIVGVYLRFDKTVGIVLAILATALFVLRPLVKGAMFLVKKRSEMRFRPVGLLVFGIILAAGVFIITVPWSNNTVYPCYVRSSLVRQIVVPVEAPVEKVFVRQGDRVHAGQTVLRMDSTRLEYELKMKEQELALVNEEMSIIEGMGKDLAKLRLKFIELNQVQDSIQDIKIELANLTWKAPFDGVVTQLEPKLQPGFAPGKGAIVGEFTGDAEGLILGFVPQIDISQVQAGADVQVWFPTGLGKTFNLVVDSVSLFHSEDLEGAPFSSRFGGEIATQKKNDQTKDSPLATQYLVKVRFPNQGQIPLGASGKLVAHHPPRSALERVVNLAYRTFRWETIF